MPHDGVGRTHTGNAGTGCASMKVETHDTDDT